MGGPYRAAGVGRVRADYRHRRGMDWHRPDRHHPDRTGHPRRRTHRRQQIKARRMTQE